jgi:hypothetical protein
MADASSSSGSFAPGAAVRIFGLVKAAQHNGKTGTISARRAASSGRVGVSLDDGSATLSVRPANLELLEVLPAAAKAAPSPAPPAPLPEEEKPRTLKMETQILAEFVGNRDPDLAALYHHRRDMAFDAFNVPEYTAQVLDYYEKGLAVVEVVPRLLGGTPCFLVCLAHPDKDRNTLCQMAFQCRRQFLGYSMLVKQHCFVCQRPGAAKCSKCECACFCSSECETQGRAEHALLCKLVRASKVNLDTEVVQLL